MQTPQIKGDQSEYLEALRRVKMDPHESTLMEVPREEEEEILDEADSDDHDDQQAQLKDEKQMYSNRTKRPRKAQERRAK